MVNLKYEKVEIGPKFDDIGKVVRRSIVGD
jgi:hypothetical protein